MKKNILKLIGLGIAFIFISIIVLGLEPATEEPNQIYGASFNEKYAKELGLDWKETYDAMLHDLGIRHLRLSAHWDSVEPERGKFYFDDLDYQMREAERVGAKVIFAVGRRLPRWPECHVPEWAKDLSWEEQKIEILEYIREVVYRYKNSKALEYWQVENEPYLEVFATEHCGQLDEKFLESEIELVKRLNPSKEVIVTDSGNLGSWFGPYQKGDLFGSSVYVYLWNDFIGPFKSKLPISWYRFKSHLMEGLYGDKDMFLIELAAEPWLLQPVVDTPIETQLQRMNIEKLEEILVYADKIGFSRQYLWGLEWWYWMKQNDHPEFWERGRILYNKE